MLVDSKQVYGYFVEHMKTVMDNIDTIVTVKHALRDGELEIAAEAWAEINDAKVLQKLSLAPTKGGCFTTEEKRLMTSDDFKDLYRQYRLGRQMEGL